MPVEQVAVLAVFAGVFVVAMVHRWDFAALVFGLATLALGHQIAGVL
jgi:hypothetical protein